MSDPNLNRDACYLRKGNKMFSPVNEKGKRDVEPEYPSINAAKRRSHELMKLKFKIVTRA